jgi:hypothetical protein
LLAELITVMNINALFADGHQSIRTHTHMILFGNGALAHTGGPPPHTKWSKSSVHHRGFLLKSMNLTSKGFSILIYAPFLLRSAWAGKCY